MGSLQGASGAQGANLTPLHICPNCAAYVVAAMWSEHVSDRCVRNVWSCDVCRFEFETAATFVVRETSN